MTRIIALLLAAMLTACATGNTGGQLAERPPGLPVAKAALAGGAPAVALQICNDLLLKEPRSVAVQTCQGDALSALNRRSEAEAAFARAQALAPNDTRVLMGLGRLRLTTDPVAAEMLFLRVVTEDPRVAAGWNDLGIARDLQGRHVEAQDAYARAIALQPDMRAAEVNLALSMAMSGRAGEAARRLQALARDPTASPRLRDNLALALTLADRPDEAEKLLRAEMSQSEVDRALAGYRALQASPSSSRVPSSPTAGAPPP